MRRPCSISGTKFGFDRPMRMDHAAYWASEIKDPRVFRDVNQIKHPGTSDFDYMPLMVYLKNLCASKRSFSEWWEPVVSPIPVGVSFPVAFTKLLVSAVNVSPISIKFLSDSIQVRSSRIGESRFKDFKHIHRPALKYLWGSMVRSVQWDGNSSRARRAYKHVFRQKPSPHNMLSRRGAPKHMAHRKPTHDLNLVRRRLWRPLPELGPIPIAMLLGHKVKGLAVLQALLLGQQLCLLLKTCDFLSGKMEKSHEESSMNVTKHSSPTSRLCSQRKKAGKTNSVPLEASRVWARGQHCLPPKSVASKEEGVKRRDFGGSRREVLFTSHWPDARTSNHCRSRCSLALTRGTRKLSGEGATVKAQNATGDQMRQL